MRKYEQNGWRKKSFICKFVFCNNIRVFDGKLLLGWAERKSWTFLWLPENTSGQERTYAERVSTFSVNVGELWGLTEYVFFTSVHHWMYVQWTRTASVWVQYSYCTWKILKVIYQKNWDILEIQWTLMLTSALEYETWRARTTFLRAFLHLCSPKSMVGHIIQAISLISLLSIYQLC